MTQEADLEEKRHLCEAWLSTEEGQKELREAEERAKKGADVYRHSLKVPLELLRKPLRT